MKRAWKGGWSHVAAVAAAATAMAVLSASAIAADKPVAAAAAAPKPAAPAGQDGNAPPPAADPRLPEGWKLLYSQTFDKPESINDFEFSSPEKWQWTPLSKGGCLESLGAGKYKTKVRSPFVIALISGKVFGDFLVEAELLQTGKEYGHRDMCVFFGFTDPSK